MRLDHPQPMLDIQTNLDLPALDRALAGTQFAGHLHHLPSTPSTQTLALAAAHAGDRAGVWIADTQTAGRGRGGHTWHAAPHDSLLLSALVAPPIPLPSAMHLSLLTALAAQAAITDITPFAAPNDIDIRWPNDLILRGRKVGGILIESTAAPAPTAAQPPMLRFAVIGIGLNCNQLAFPPDLDPIATSLRRELPPQAPPLAREPLLTALLRHLDAGLRELTRDPHAVLARDLSRHSTWLTGKPVTVPEDGGYTGITAGLTPDGFLQVRLADGTLRTVRSGGVRSRNLPTETSN